MTIGEKLITTTENEREINEKLIAIADKIRDCSPYLTERLGKTKLTLDDMADVGILSVLMDGENRGYYNGYESGYYDGAQAEHNSFWDNLQANGKRTEYANAFYCFPVEHFYPTNDLIATSCTNMFRFCGRRRGAGGDVAKDTKIDLTERLEECGVKLDVSQCSSLEGLYVSCTGFSRVPVIDSRSSPTINSTFTYSEINKIDKIILKDDGSQTIGNAFGSCNHLIDIEFDGVIGRDINFSSSPLSTKSIVSVIEHLSDNQGATLTLNRAAVENMVFPFTSEQSGTIYNSWDELIATKPNWTITLV